MTLEHVIDSYGYLALVVGTFLEGETILVLGGIAAKLGYLRLPWVIVSAFVGTLMSDQLFFFLGRWQGQAFLLKHPHWQSRAEKVRRMLERHRIPIIIGFRFVYGFRTVTPFVLGMSRVPVIEFVVFNIVGAAAWASTIAGLGYAFGKAMELLLGDLRHYEKWILLSVIAVGTIIWLLHLASDKKRRNDGDRYGR
jgi:membrane protein DedA with SNARE-associated domain